MGWNRTKERCKRGLFMADPLSPGEMIRQAQAQLERLKAVFLKKRLDLEKPKEKIRTEGE